MSYVDIKGVFEAVLVFKSVFLFNFNMSFGQNLMSMIFSERNR
jgi:hypothetical protein